MAVIGGGPAGASAAREAAKLGLAVLLFDHSHPRRKACGGGLPVKGIEAMDVPAEVIERKMETIVYRYRGRTLRVRVNKGRLVRRDVWDHYLFRRAVEAGAQPVKQRVTSLVHDDDGWLVNSTHRARRLIGADGVNGLCRRTLSSPIPREHLFASFGYYVGVEPDNGDVEFILGELPAEGYLWVFPKADHYNVGACYPPRTPGARQALDALVERRWPGALAGRLATGEAVDCQRFGAAIPAATDPRFFDAPVTGDDWVLCGDAAGHVNPIHGEGLNHAVQGGRLAARAVAEGDPRRFESYWRTAYRDEMYRAARTRRTIYRPLFMRLGFALGATPALFGLLAALTRDEYHGKAVRSFWFRLPLALVQALFRRRHRELRAK